GVLIAYDAIIYIALGMLLALLIQFGIAPRIVARENLMLWHSLVKNYPMSITMKIQICLAMQTLNQ
ncbi:MAG: hypothetical protein KA454_10100, partial [Polaromonas sp.]|nr:hypothetical protein [Polaromonas sp.]